MHIAHMYSDCSGFKFLINYKERGLHDKFKYNIKGKYKYKTLCNLNLVLDFRSHVLNGKNLCSNLIHKVSSTIQCYSSQCEILTK